MRRLALSRSLAAPQVDAAVDAVAGGFEFWLLCVRVAAAEVVGLRELGPPLPAPVPQQQRVQPPPPPPAPDAAPVRAWACARMRARVRSAARARVAAVCLTRLRCVGTCYADVARRRLAPRAAAQRAGVRPVCGG